MPLKNDSCEFDIDGNCTALACFASDVKCGACNEDRIPNYVSTREAAKLIE